MYHWNTGVMVAYNGPLYASVDIPLKKLPFPATIVIYNIKLETAELKKTIMENLHR